MGMLCSAYRSVFLIKRTTAGCPTRRTSAVVLLYPLIVRLFIVKVIRTMKTGINALFLVAPLPIRLKSVRLPFGAALLQ